MSTREHQDTSGDVLGHDLPEDHGSARIRQRSGGGVMQNSESPERDRGRGGETAEPPGPRAPHPPGTKGPLHGADRRFAIVRQRDVVGQVTREDARETS
jgi:hypothetical protein